MSVDRIDWEQFDSDRKGFFWSKWKGRRHERFFGNWESWAVTTFASLFAAVLVAEYFPVKPWIAPSLGILYLSVFCVLLGFTGIEEWLYAKLFRGEGHSYSFEMPEDAFRENFSCVFRSIKKNILITIPFLFGILYLLGTSWEKEIPPLAIALVATAFYTGAFCAAFRIRGTRAEHVVVGILAGAATALLYFFMLAVPPSKTSVFLLNCLHDFLLFIFLFGLVHASSWGRKASARILAERERIDKVDQI